MSSKTSNHDFLETATSATKWQSLETQQVLPKIRSAKKALSTLSNDLVSLLSLLQQTTLNHALEQSKLSLLDRCLEDQRLLLTEVDALCSAARWAVDIASPKPSSGGSATSRKKTTRK